MYKVEVEVGAEGEDPEREEHAEGKVKKLREELSACRQQKQEYMDGWQRAKADYVNALKRFEVEQASARERGIDEAVRALLPAVDALDRARAHGDIPDGFKAIVKQLDNALDSLKLVSFGEVNARFDPVWYEALGTDLTDKDELDGTISTILERGWARAEFNDPNGTVLRPAKVRVYHKS